MSGVDPRPGKTGCLDAHVAWLAAGAVLVALVVTTVHWPALSARALAIDDDSYLTANPLVQNPSPDNAWRFLTEVLEPSTVAGYYQPLTMISLMLDTALGGGPDHLRPYHRTSLALHVLNTILILLLLYQLFGNPAAAILVALLFGVHPLTVEPIPWVAERKTLLATLFALGCLILYVRHARRADWRFYVGAVVLCALAMMSKPTTTPLPLLLLLLDCWPLRRLNLSALWEKTPFILLAVIFAVITFISQTRAASTTLPTEYAPARIPLILGHNIAFYLGKIVWPANLSAYYAFPRPFGLSNPVLLASVAGTTLWLVVLAVSWRWTKALAIGWVFFFVALFPTVGVVGFTIVIASDKYAYLPVLGLLMPLAALLAWAWERPGPGLSRRGRRAGLVVVVGVAAVLCGMRTRDYLRVWQDTDGLFQHMLRLAPDAPVLHNNYGVVLANSGRLEEALEHYRRAAELNPDFWMARTNVAITLGELGRLSEAEAACREMVAAAPHNPVVYFNLANVLLRQDRRDEAYAAFAEAVRLDPQYARAYTNWGVALVEAGDSAAAIRHLATAVSLDPEDALAHYNLALALSNTGRLERAIHHYQETLRLKPRSPRAYANLGLTYAALGRMPAAERCLRAALELDPNDAVAHVNFGGLAIQGNRPDIAELHFRRAVELDPENVEANNNLGTLLAQQGKSEDAIPYLSAAVRLRPEHANAHFMLGCALAAEQRFGEAIEHFQRAAALQPADLEAHERLAAAWAAVGNPTEASAAAARALELAQARGDTVAATRLEQQLTRYRAGPAGPTSAPSDRP